MEKVVNVSSELFRNGEWTDEELAAGRWAIELADGECDDERLANAIEGDWLTLNEGNDGKTYAWYECGSKSCAVEVGNKANTINNEEDIDKMFR